MVDLAKHAAPEQARSVSTTDFIKALFAYTTGPTYVCSFPNERDDPNQASERHIIGRDAAQIGMFLAKWDKPGRGAFACVGVLQEGAQRRAKENIAQTTCLHNDIDFKDLDTLGEDPTSFVMRHLARLKYPPSIIVLSGGGVHCYWLFKEPLDTQAEMERVEIALRQLADLVAGDLAVCEVSRVMRLPGTHNTKNDAWKEVVIASFEPDRRYDLEELEEWLSEQSPVMLRKSREQGKDGRRGGGRRRVCQVCGIRQAVRHQAAD